MNVFNLATLQLALIALVGCWFYRGVLTYPVAPADRSRWAAANLGLLALSVYAWSLTGLWPFHPGG